MTEMPAIPDDDADFTPELARKIIAEYQKIITDLTDPTLKSMRLENGKFDMAMGGKVVERLALMMTEWFREGGAKNYVEMTLNARDEPFESYLFYVQKRGDGALTPAEQAEELKAEIARYAAHVVDLQAECDEMYADQMRTLDAVGSAGAAIEKGHSPKAVLELLEKVLTLHEKKRINEAPKDGSTQAFDVSFKARAFWDAEQRQWVLAHPLSLEYLPTHARWLGPARVVEQK